MKKQASNLCRCGNCIYLTCPIPMRGKSLLDIRSLFSLWHRCGQGKKILFCAYHNMFTCKLNQITSSHNFINLKTQNTRHTALQSVLLGEKLPGFSKNIGRITLFSNRECLRHPANSYSKPLAKQTSSYV